jgi:hypothetical protein
MISLKGALVGLFTGIFLALAWVLFIDGQIHSPDAFPPLHILPPLFATIGAVMMNLVTVEIATNDTRAKVWLFFWVTVQTICVGSAIFILSTEYPIDDNYPGLAIMLNTIFIMFGGFLFFIGRAK